MKHIHPKLEDWLILIKNHINKRPLIKPSDVYKLIYQGILGPEHLISSESIYAEHLKAEYEGLTANGDDPLLEIIHPHATLVRVNLKPFKAAELDLNMLLDASFQTAKRKWGSITELRSLWETLVYNYHREKRAAFTQDEMFEFTSWLVSRDYPAVHHSQAYRQAYQPAYRLVAADLASQWFHTSEQQE